jgi:multisubunit Na+/H+ antiporter MnhC subunit
MPGQRTEPVAGDAGAGHFRGGRQDQPAARSSALDWLQTFGALAAVAIAFVTAGTSRSRITVALAICAAVVICVLVSQAATHRPWTGRRRLLIGTQFVAPLVLIVTATVISAGVDSPRPAQAGAGQQSIGADPAPVMTRRGYQLTPSAFIDTNDQDKIDFDSGCPGWGDMHPHLGPSRCGELADLIVDEQGIHTRDGGPHFIRLDAGEAGGFRRCRDALTAEPNQAVNQLGVDGLRNSTQLCVETEQRNIALVRVDLLAVNRLDQLTAMTISFTMWRSRA